MTFWDWMHEHWWVGFWLFFWVCFIVGNVLGNVIITALKIPVMLRYGWPIKAPKGIDVTVHEYAHGIYGASNEPRTSHARTLKGKLFILGKKREGHLPLTESKP